MSHLIPRVFHRNRDRAASRLVATRSRLTRLSTYRLAQDLSNDEAKDPQGTDRSRRVDRDHHLHRRLASSQSRGGNRGRRERGHPKRFSDHGSKNNPRAMS